MEFTFFVANIAPGQESVLALTADNILYKLDKQDTQKKSDKFCQDNVGQHFRISCFTEKCVRNARPIDQK